MRVIATCTKSVGLGAFGACRGCMPAWLGRRSPLRRLHGAQQVTMLSQAEVPPLERGITWSIVSVARSLPQYWQVHWSRAKIARRVILRLWAAPGVGTEVGRGKTTGPGH